MRAKRRNETNPRRTVGYSSDLLRSFSSSRLLSLLPRRFILSILLSLVRISSWMTRIGSSSDSELVRILVVDGTVVCSRKGQQKSEKGQQKSEEDDMQARKVACGSKEGDEREVYRRRTSSIELLQNSKALSF